MVAQASETFTSANQATILGLYLGSNGGNGTLTQVLAATSSLLTIPITAIINPTVSQSTPFSISGQLITTGSSYPKIMNVNATIKPTATTPWVAGLTFAPSIVRVDASNSYNVSEAFGILARVDLHADYTGTVTSLKQFNIQSAYKGVSGTITTLYGLYVDAITSGGTNYDVYLAGSAAYKATGTTWQNPSDRRLKDNVKPFLDGLDKLLLINPVTYELNGEDGTRKGTKGISVIAQEIQPIFPYMIKSHPGTISGEKTKVLEIDSSAMTWILVNSVKELSTKIKRLEEICKQ